MEARMRPAWALPAPDDSIIEREDLMLFEYAYSDDLYCTTRLFVAMELLRKFRAGYGGMIPCASLRHAILGLAASEIQYRERVDQSYEGKRVDHINKACRALMTKKAKDIEDGDVFAALLLSFTTTGFDEQYYNHKKGMLSMLNILNSRRATKGTRDMFDCFRPVFVEYLLPDASADVTQRHVRLFGAISFPLTTYHERIRMFSELFGFTQTARLPGSGAIVSRQAILWTLEWNIMDMVNGLLLIIEREKKDCREWDPFLRFMGTRWKADMETTDYQQLQILTTLPIHTITSSNNTEIPELCVVYLVHCLLYELVNGTVLSQSLCLAETITSAWTLVSFLKTLEGNFDYSHRWDPSTQMYLFLGACALPESEARTASAFLMCIWLIFGSLSLDTGPSQK